MTFEASIPGEVSKSFHQDAQHLPDKSTAAAVHSLCRTENHALFPQFARFERDWGIRIPLDPAISFLPDFVTERIFQRDYEITLTYGSLDSDTDFKVEFLIRSKASRDVLRERFNEILQMYGSWKVDPKTRRTRQRQKLADYVKMFRAYDLHQEGQSASEIATKLSPKEFERDQRVYPGRNSTVQLMHDLIKDAKKRINDAKR
jgi:hypothetical protein